MLSSILHIGWNLNNSHRRKRKKTTHFCCITLVTGISRTIINNEPPRKLETNFWPDTTEIDKLIYSMCIFSCWLFSKSKGINSIEFGVEVMCFKTSTWFWQILSANVFEWDWGQLRKYPITPNISNYWIQYSIYKMFLTNTIYDGVVGSRR